MSNKKLIKRRGFLKGTAAACTGVLSFPYIIQSSALGKGETPAASERITVGCIGVGPQGNWVMGNFLAQNDVVVSAVCDVKSNVLEQTVNRVNDHYQNKDCKGYSDFRKLLARDDIDAVLIATPDHWHVPVAIAAAKAKKDMYLEKPMGLSMEQDQALRDAVKRYGRIFQFGTQQRSSWQFLKACELALNGYIGELKEINVWCWGSSSGGDPTPVPVPEWLDYDMWLGPAPFTPYTKDRCSNELWWFISDYALGWIAGWGVHPLDIALWGGADKADGDFEIEGKGTFPTEGVCDTAMNWDLVLRYDSGVVMNYTGWPCREGWQERYGKIEGYGTVFEGTEGWVHVDRSRIQAKPDKLVKVEFGPKDKRLYLSSGHVRNFVDCIKSRNKTVCDVETAVKADILCQVSNIATRLGSKLRWDSKKERFVDNEAANRMLSCSMGSPWGL
jgi:predicted dehydrogenase